MGQAVTTEYNGPGSGTGGTMTYSRGAFELVKKCEVKWPDGDVLTGRIEHKFGRPTLVHNCILNSHHGYEVHIEIPDHAMYTPWRSQEFSDGTRIIGPFDWGIRSVTGNRCELRKTVGNSRIVQTGVYSANALLGRPVLDTITKIVVYTNYGTATCSDVLAGEFTWLDHHVSRHRSPLVGKGFDINRCVFAFACKQTFTNYFAHSDAFVGRILEYIGSLMFTLDSQELGHDTMEGHVAICGQGGQRFQFDGMCTLTRANGLRIEGPCINGRFVGGVHVTVPKWNSTYIVRMTEQGTLTSDSYILPNEDWEGPSYGPPKLPYCIACQNCGHRCSHTYLSESVSDWSERMQRTLCPPSAPPAEDEEPSAPPAEEGGEECAICMEQRELRTLVACRHKMCVKCVQTIVTNGFGTKEGALCPFCKSSMLVA